MQPQELKAMGPDMEVFLYEGIPASGENATQIRYYKDRYFHRPVATKGGCSDAERLIHDA